MKQIFSLFALMFGLSAQAGTLLSAAVESSTGKLYQAGWASCEAEVLSQSDNSMQMKIKLVSAKTPATFERNLMLNTEDLNFLFDIRWDFGFSEKPVAIAGTSFSTLLSHRVRVEENHLVYRLWFVESTDDIPFSTSELVCRFSKN